MGIEDRVPYRLVFFYLFNDAINDLVYIALYDTSIMNDGLIET